MVLNHSFWRGKRVFLSGHTGFKGGWLALWLSEMGAEGARLCVGAFYRSEFLRCDRFGRSPRQ